MHIHIDMLRDSVSHAVREVYEALVYSVLELVGIGMTWFLSSS